MPTSNGQVTSRDIRQNAVKTLHLLDEAVTTAKIPDLAVTFPDKIDSPIWSAAFGALLFHNVSLTTTPTVFGSVDIDIPAWVDQVAIFAVGVFQITNTSGAEVSVFPGIEIDGDVVGGQTHEIPDSSTKTVGPILDTQNSAGVAGSTITVSMEVFLSTGTNSANFGRIAGIAVGTR